MFLSRLTMIMLFDRIGSYCFLAVSGASPAVDLLSEMSFFRGKAAGMKYLLPHRSKSPLSEVFCSLRLIREALWKTSLRHPCLLPGGFLLSRSENHYSRCNMVFFICNAFFAPSAAESIVPVLFLNDRQDGISSGCVHLS